MNKDHSKKPNSSAARKNVAGATKATTATPASTLLNDIAARGGAISKMRSSYRKERLAETVKAIEQGLELREASKAQWGAFMELPFWKEHPKSKPKVHEQNQAVRFVVRLRYDEDVRGSKNASAAFIATEYLLSKGVPSMDIPAKLRSGPSIRKLCDQQAANKRSGLAEKPIESERPSHIKVKLCGKLRRLISNGKDGDIGQCRYRIDSAADGKITLLR